MFNQVAIGIVVLVVLVVAIYLIALLRKAGETLENIQSLTTTAKSELRPAIEEMHSSARDLRNLTENIDDKLAKTEKLFEIIDEISDSLKVPATVASKAAEAGVISLSSLVAGIKEGLKSWYSSSKGEENEAEGKG